MYLCDREIQELIDKEFFIIRSTNPDLPFKDLTNSRNGGNESQIQPASIDLRVSNIFIKFKQSIRFIDVSEFVDAPGFPQTQKKNMESLVERISLNPNQPIEIPANGWIGGQTLEYIGIPDGIAIKIATRSRIARMGVSVCIADFGNPLYEGVIPLQIINHNPFPVRIYPYMGICQIMVVRLNGYPEQKYPSLNPPYQGEVESQVTVLKDDVLTQAALDRNEDQ